MIHFIDLFAGIGGIRLGAYNALKANGIEADCVLSSEINDKACETYMLNFGEQPQGDIREIEEIQPFDFLLGGFPCQPFSYAGKRMGFGDTRISDIIPSLLAKGYLQEKEGRYTLVCGNMSFEVFKFLDPDSISITLTSSDSNRLGVIQNNMARHITPRECARLQGFPDSFIVHPNDTYAYKQFGNSVSVPVIEAIVNDFIQQNKLALGWTAKETGINLDRKITENKRTFAAV